MPLGGDIIELTHDQEYLGQTISNVYFFEAIDGTATLSALATWFETNLVPAIKSLQSDLVAHKLLRLRNIFDAGETYEEPLTGVGASASGVNELPAFFAASIRLEHTTGNIRPGFKRFSGSTEIYLEDALWTAAFVLSVDNIGSMLVNPPGPANPGWAHVIVKRICNTINPVPGGVPACIEYRLPLNQGEASVAYPVSYVSIAQPTTQNSRKWYT